MLTILGNLRINSEAKLQHMKDSFLSCNTISDNWVINIRGEFRDEAIHFLKDKLGDSLVLHVLLDETRGWVVNTREMIPSVKYDYLLLWNEEQINIAPQEVYLRIVQEMSDSKSDYLMYSWWLNGKTREAFDVLPSSHKKYIDVISLTKISWQKILKTKADHPYFLTSLIAVYKKDFFEKILELDSRWVFPVGTRKNLYRIESLLIYFGFPIKPGEFFWFINRLTGYRISQWTKEPPFNIEKHKERFDVLPFTMALPKQELFACIDDDLNMSGYQLIKRGLYPSPEIPTINTGKIMKEPWGSSELLEENAIYRVEKIHLLSGTVYSNLYYEDSGQRTSDIAQITIISEVGSLKVSTEVGRVIVSPSKTISLYPNIQYSITCEIDAQFLIVSPTQKNKHIVRIQ